MIRNPFRRRWVVAIVGEVSGERRPIHFCRFWRRGSAELFAAQGNARYQRQWRTPYAPLTKYVVERRS